MPELLSLFLTQGWTQCLFNLSFFLNDVQTSFSPWFCYNCIIRIIYLSYFPFLRWIWITDFFLGIQLIQDNFPMIFFLCISIISSVAQDYLLIFLLVTFCIDNAFYREYSQAIKSLFIGIWLFYRFICVHMLIVLFHRKFVTLAFFRITNSSPKSEHSFVFLWFMKNTM